MYLLGDAYETATLIKGQLQKRAASAALMEATTDLLEQIDAIVVLVEGPKAVQGLYRNPELLSSKRSDARRSLQDIIYPVTETQEKLVRQFATALQPVVQQIDDFLQTDWKAYQATVEAAGFGWFKP
jgi:hypothetical protein